MNSSPPPCVSIPEACRDFEILCYELTLRAEQFIPLPQFLGSTLHGGFGAALQQTGCMKASPSHCPPCEFPRQCPYNLLFLDPGLATKNLPKRYATAPKLMVIQVPFPSPTRLEPGQRLTFRLLLFGPAIALRIYPIVAMRILAEQGLGYRRGRFTLENITSLNPLTGERHHIYSSADQMVHQNDEPFTIAELCQWADSWSLGNLIKLSFVTPVRLFGRGYSPANLDLKIVLKSALERLCILSHVSGAPCPSVDFDTPLAAAGKISVLSRAVAIHDWSRYSKRKDLRMSMGGFVGHMILQGDFTSLKPYLKIAEVLHVGSNPSFGLGQLRFEAIT
jgi:hypothetical protein